MKPEMSFANGHEVPKGCIPAWMLEEEGKNRLVTTKREIQYNPSNHFQLLHYLGDDVIVGYLGHNNANHQLGAARFHTRVRNDLYTYFINYAEGKPVYVTFDQVTVFRLIHILPEADGALQWHFKRVSRPTHTVIGQAFMIMPFGDTSLDQFYEQHVRVYLNDELKVKVVRADSPHDNDFVSETILRMIRESELVIADSTANNKNVFYEIGYAEGQGKEIILMQDQKEERIFFDQAHRRAILYNQDGVDDFKKQLLATVQAVRRRISAST